MAFLSSFFPARTLHPCIRVNVVLAAKRSTPCRKDGPSFFSFLQKSFCLDSQFSKAKNSNKWLSTHMSSVVLHCAVSRCIICFSFSLKSRLPTKPRFRRTCVQVPQTLFGSNKSFDANLTVDTLQKGLKVLRKHERLAETWFNCCCWKISVNNNI